MVTGSKVIKGVIFDLDGTLLDSRGIRARAWALALHNLGIEVPEDEILPLIGLPGETLASRFSDDPLSVEREEERIFSSQLSKVDYFPDVHDTLRLLKELGIAVSIVTSSRRALLDQIPIPVETVICIDDVKNGKPDTEPYELAAERMKVDLRNILVVGDSENDMIPCMHTGSVCVFFRDRRSIESSNCHYYADHISEIPLIVQKINSKAIKS